MEPENRLAEARKQTEIVIEAEQETLPLDKLATLHRTASQLAEVEEWIEGGGEEVA